MHQFWIQSLVAVSALGGVSATPVDVGSDLVERASSTGNHSAATAPFWEGYNYCQGRTINPSKYLPIKGAKMVKLVEMNRHGARSPAAIVPGDQTPWYQCGSPDEFVYMDNSSTLSATRTPFMRDGTIIDGAFAYTIWKGNCDAGQLTNFGSSQLLQLGQTLRSVYVDNLGFLPAEMATSFNIRHTYIQRTQESAENLFSGLYPLNTRPPNATLTMHVKPSTIELMIPNTSACPKLNNLTAQYAASSAYAGTLSSYSAVQNTLVSAYNVTGVKGFNTTGGLYDTASAAYCAGLGLKGNLTAADIQQAVVPGTSAYHNLLRPSNPNAEEAKQLAVGGWLVEVLGALSNYTYPLDVYSAHDASLDMFLAIVADPDLPWPPFASNILTEVWQPQSGEPVVRMFYEGMVVPAAPGLNCSFEACPLATLEKYLQGYIPANFKTACSL